MKNTTKIMSLIQEALEVFFVFSLCLLKIITVILNT